MSVTSIDIGNLVISSVSAEPQNYASTPTGTIYNRANDGRGEEV
jgi:hypothetical protein